MHTIAVDILYISVKALSKKRIILYFITYNDIGLFYT